MKAHAADEYVFAKQAAFGKVHYTRWGCSTGTWLTGSAHIITAVIGSGVLSLAWAVTWFGWIAGPLALVFFPAVTWYCSHMLIDCCKPRSSSGGVCTRNEGRGL